MKVQTNSEFSKVALDLLKLIRSEQGETEPSEPQEVETTMLRLYNTCLMAVMGLDPR